MGTDLNFQCRCGSVKGVCRAAGPVAGIRAVCYCRDCQAFARFLCRESEMLDARGGTDIYQTAPSRLEILTGVEKIARVALSPKGLHRWYAACCNTALANTAQHRLVPFAGTFVANYDEARREAVFGPVATAVFVKESYDRQTPVPIKPMVAVLADMIRRALGEWLTGRWRRHPYFAAADAGKIGPAIVLDAEQRARAYERPAPATAVQQCVRT